MRQTVAGPALAVIVALAAGCGGSDTSNSPSDRFVGIYAVSESGFVPTGPMTPPMSGPPYVLLLGAYLFVQIDRLSETQVGMGLCFDVDGKEGPIATAVDGSTLNVGSFDCKIPTPTECEGTPSVTHIEGGMATLNNGTLSITLTESETYCGHTQPGTFTLTATPAK
jgi:hypothetical protein